MPIKVKCRCGKILSAPDTLAGKKAKCPECNQIIQIPTPAVDQAPSTPSAAQRTASPGKKCPGCGKTYPADVVFCTSCGINLQTGKALAVPGIPPGGSATGSPKTGEPVSGTSGRDKKVVAGAVAGGVVVLLLVLYFVFFRGPAIVDNTLAMLPENATILGRLEVGRLLRIPAVKEGITEVKDQKEYELFKKAGLWPENIEQVYFAVDLSQLISGGSDAEAVALVELSAAIDKDKLTEALKKTGALKCEKSVEGFDGYVLKAEGQSVSPLLVILDEKRLAVGTSKMVEKTVALASGGGGNITENSELMAVCEGGGLKDLFWLAIQLPKEEMKKLGKTPGLKPPIKPEEIKGALIRVDYSSDTGLSFGTAIVCASEEIASKAKPEFEKMAKGMGEFFLNVAKDAISVKQDGAKVALDVRISDKVLAKLTDKAKEQVAMVAMSPEERQRHQMQQQVGQQIEYLKGDDKNKRQWALMFFAQGDLELGDKQAEVVRLLTEAGKNPEPEYSQMALQALKKVAPDTDLSAALKTTAQRTQFHQIASLPALHDGVLYFCTHDKKCCAMHLKSGKLKWKTSVKQFGPWVRVRDDKVFFGRQGVCVLDAKTGEKVLERKNEERAYKWPILRGDTLFLRLYPKKIVGIALKDGNELWSHQAISPDYCVFGNEVVYLVPEDNRKHLQALDIRTGKPKWTSELEMSMQAAFVYDDGLIYVPATVQNEKGGLVRQLIALDTNSGKTKWALSLDKTEKGKAKGRSGTIYTVPAAAEGSVYFVVRFDYPEKISENETKYHPEFHLFAADAKTGEKQWETVVEPKEGQPIIHVVGDRLVCAFRNGKQFVACERKTGVILWTVKMNGQGSSQYAIGEGILCYISIEGGTRKAYAVDIGTGKKLWTFDKAETYRAPLLQDGRAFFFTHSGLYEVDLKTGREVVYEGGDVSKIARKVEKKAGERKEKSPVERHLDDLGSRSEAQRGQAVRFFADCRKPLGNMESDVLRGLVEIARTGTDLARKKDDNLRYHAVRAIRHLRPEALKAAFPTLSEFLRQVYLPTGCPLIADGVMYVSCKAPAIVALDLETWDEKWFFEKASSHYGPVLKNGLLYFDRSAVDPETGKRKWHYEGKDFTRSPLLVTADTVYFGAEYWYACAVDAKTGEEKWVYNAGGEVHLQYGPRLVGDVLCMADCRNSVYGLDAKTGKERWKFTFKLKQSTDLALRDGILYFAADSGLYGLNPKTGEQVWRTEEIDSPPLVVENVIYGHPPRGGCFAALDRKSGKVLWKMKTVERSSFVTHIPPVTDGERVCFVIHAHGQDIGSSVIAVDRKSGEKLWTFSLPKDCKINNRMVVSGGRLYVNSDSVIYELDMKTGKEIEYEPPASLKVAATEKKSNLPSEGEIVSREQGVFGGGERKPYIGDEKPGAKTRGEDLPAAFAKIISISGRNVTLEAALKDFEKQTGIPVEIANGVDGKRQMGGLLLQKQSAKKALDWIVKMYKVKYEIKDGRVHISPRSL